MNPNRSKRRVHSSDFKAQVLGECRQPGASVAAVAIGHGLNPNVVRKWLAGQNLKRMSAEIPVTASRVPPLQFVPVELTKAEHLASLAPSPPDIRIELRRGATSIAVTISASDGKR